MKTIVTLAFAAIAMIAGGSTLSAGNYVPACPCAPRCAVPRPICCQPKPRCITYTCANSPEYQDYWRNQTSYQGAPNASGAMTFNSNNANQNTNVDQNAYNSGSTMMNRDSGMMNRNSYDSNMMNQNSGMMGPDSDMNQNSYMNDNR